MLTNKRILVTGGAGFLGSHIVDALRLRGCESVTAPRRAEFDLTTEAGVDGVFRACRPEVLIHAAAVVGGIGANQSNPGRYFYENAIMGILILEAARGYAVEKTVVLGTICSYPKHTSVPFREDDLWNGYPEETNAPYGIAKKALLVQCQAYRRQYGMKSVYLMPVNLYGPRDNFDPSTSHVIPAMIRKCEQARLRNAPEVVLWGDGSATREFLYVEDCAEAVILAAERYDKPDPVNIGSGWEISIRELAGLIAGECGFAGSIRWDTTKPSGQPRRCLSVERASNEFGFRAATAFLAGLRRTIEWYRQNLPSNSQ